MRATRPPVRTRSLPGRLAVATLMVLHALLGAAVVVADGRPASGHAQAAEGGVLFAAPSSAAGPVAWLDGPHDCPFCTYLAGQHTTTPQPAAVAVSAVSTWDTVDPVVTRPRATTAFHQPQSRAPPVL